MVKSLSKIALILAGAAVVLGLVSGPTYADINSIERINQYYTTFDNPNNFANAVGQYDITQTYTMNPGDVTTATFGLPTGYYNLSWTGDANIGVSNITTTATSATGTLTALTTLTGQTGSTVLVTDWPAASGNPITVGVVGGSYVLEEQFTSAGGVNNGFPYTWQMKILGNWSTVGTNPGDHELLGFNSTDWQIDTDFVFDGTNTVFSAHAIDGYTLGNNIDLDFQLYGAAVPLPPTVWLFGSGLLGLVGWRRFRKG